MARYITELFYDDQWNDITPDVRDSAPIILERGRRDWATETDPSTCSLRLNNGASSAAAGITGRYSPRNPRSDLFGKIGRNTPLRVREDRSRDAHGVLPGFNDSYISTPDVAALDVTGDLEIRLDIHPPSWVPDGVDLSLARKYVITSDERSWAFILDPTGNLEFNWSPNGTLASRITVFSTVPVPPESGRLALKVTLDVNNGAGGNTVTFATADSIDGTYTTLGAPVITAGVTSVHSGTADIEIGNLNRDGEGISPSDPLSGKIYGFRLYNGIAGTQVANPDFTVHEPEVRTFTDAAGRVWTLHDSAAITDSTIRFVGETNYWPVSWDLSGADQWVAIKAAGITRRLQRGTKPLKSSLFRDLSIKDDIVVYYPLEDLKGTTRFLSGLADDDSFMEPFNSVTLAADDETFFASDALPTVAVGRITGNLPAYSGDADQRLVFLVSIPEDVTWGSDQIILRAYTTGTVAYWQIEKTSADATRITAYDRDGVQVLTSLFALAFFGVPGAISLWLQQDGADIDWQVAFFPLGDDTALAATGTLAGETYGRFNRVSLGVPGNDYEGTTFGHLFILNDDVQSIWNTITNSMVGWSGETGLSRLVRLGGDEGLPPILSLGANDAETMGYQSIRTLMDLFREVPSTDLGLLTDRPDALGLQYRPRTDLYSQEPVLVLDYSDGVLDDPFRPVDDDQAVANEITVQRPRGASVTVADTTSPLSVLDPPSGVGRYDVAQEVNIDTDERLMDQAFWRLHLGTIDEARFPEIRLNLRNPRVEALEDAVLAVREGDLIRITNPPAWLPGGPYDLLVEAIREEKSADQHIVEFTCSPGSAWNVLMLDDAGFSRLDAEGATLGEALTPTQTVFDVATAAGSQVWMRQSVGLIGLGTSGSYATTPDNAALDLTASIDIRAEAQTDDWSGDVNQVLVSKWGGAGARSYLLQMTTAGRLQFAWSTDGTATMTETSDVVIPYTSGGRIALRATRNSATGDVTFYYSDSVNGTWTQIGAVQTSTPGGMFSSASAMQVGIHSGTTSPLVGTVFAAQVRSSIGGTVVANPDFTAQNGQSTFTDSAGRVWSTVGAAQISPADPFDILVAGEAMRVISITGTTSPQEFTVQRAINGVSKAQASGATVVLAQPIYLSL